ncbi:hypothetical protein DFJ77DRAFT_479661 [Powellomyces hirtus]|nr:hypothetical protein DFJ77DRAFT_479661 [Powellomyces hirtus]
MSESAAKGLLILPDHALISIAHKMVAIPDLVALLGTCRTVGKILTSATDLWTKHVFPLLIVHYTITSQFPPIGKDKNISWPCVLIRLWNCYQRECFRKRNLFGYSHLQGDSFVKPLNVSEEGRSKHLSFGSENWDIIEPLRDWNAHIERLRWADWRQCYGIENNLYFTDLCLLRRPVDARRKFEFLERGAAELLEHKEAFLDFAESLNSSAPWSKHYWTEHFGNEENYEKNIRGRVRTVPISDVLGGLDEDIEEMDSDQFSKALGLSAPMLPIRHQLHSAAGKATRFPICEDTWFGAHLITAEYIQQSLKRCRIYQVISPSSTVDLITNCFEFISNGAKPRWDWGNAEDGSIEWNLTLDMATQATNMHPEALMKFMATRLLETEPVIASLFEPCGDIIADWKATTQRAIFLRAYNIRNFHWEALRRAILKEFANDLLEDAKVLEVRLSRFKENMDNTFIQEDGSLGRRTEVIELSNFYEQGHQTPFDRDYDGVPICDLLLRDARMQYPEPRRRILGLFGRSLVLLIEVEIPYFLSFDHGQTYYHQWYWVP